MGGLITLARSGSIGTFSQNGVAATTTVDFTSGFVKLVVGSSQTLSATAGALNGLAITGTGNIVATALEGTPAADLHLITNTGTKTAAFSGTTLTFTGVLGSFTTTVVFGQTFAAAAAVVNGKTINGAGNVVVTLPTGTVSADLHLITNTGSRTAAVSDDAIFTGNLGTFTTTVAADKNFTATAAIVNGKTITADAGTGTITVTALNATASADLSHITVTGFSGTGSSGQLKAQVSGNVTFTGKLGTFTTTVAADKNFTATAAIVNGKTITADAGTGTITVTALNTTASADLSHITVTGFSGTGSSGKLKAQVSGNVTFTGNLAHFTTTVDPTKTFTAAAAVVDGMTINGAGNVVVMMTTPTGTISANLYNILNTGTKTAAVLDNVTFTGGNLGAFTITVAATRTFTADATFVTGKTINGAGNVAVTSLTAGADLHLITNSGNKTAAVSDTVIFAGNLGTFTATVAADKNFTATAAIVNGKTIIGTGAVAVTALNATSSADLSHITNTGNQMATVSGDITFTGKLGTFTTTVGTGYTFTATAAAVNGKTITGAGGNVAVTALNATAAADLHLITNGGT